MMKAIILAAGKGLRMYPLTLNCPKALLPLQGSKTILDELTTNCLRVNTVDEIVVVVCEKNLDRFKQWNQYKNVKLYVSSCNNVISCLSEAVHSIKTDSVLIAASDNILSFELQLFVDFYNQDPQSLAVMYYSEMSVDELRRTGVGLVKNDILIHMAEKPISPSSHAAIPPFYIIPQSKLHNLDCFLEQDIQVDSLGTFLSWYTERNIVRAFLMPGKRYNLGDKFSYLNYLKKVFPS